MARNILKNKNVRKISKAGKSSYYVTIPIEIVKDLGWKEGQKVVVTKLGKDKVKIEDWKS